MLLIRSKPSTMKKHPEKEKKTIKTTEKKKTAKEAKAPEISERLEAPKVLETPKKTKVLSSVKGCLHYLGYLEKLSTSSFPYECLACPKLGECIGENKKKQEKIVSDIGEYRIAERIEATIEKANNAPWKPWRGKNEQAVPGDQVPELYELLKELGGRIKHNDWEYQCYEKPLNIVVRTKA